MTTYDTYEIYEITDANGTRYTYDARILDEGAALELAQRIADCEGETVYIHGPGDAYEEGMEIDPTPIAR